MWSNSKPILKSYALKNKGPLVFWHWQFHEESLTSMETFYSTKCSLQWEKFPHK